MEKSTSGYIYLINTLILFSTYYCNWKKGISEDRQLKNELIFIYYW